MTAPSGHVVLITGTSSGIGLASAIAAAQAGFTTVATVRDPQRATALREAAGAAGVDLDIRRLDITDGASIAACVRGVTAAHGRLDALVNNAGVAGGSPTMELSTMEALRANMEVNFFGVVAMSRAAMPHLRAGGGRLITISSVRGVIGQPFNEAYSAAKFAVEGFMEALAPVAAEVGVSVSVIEPAAVLDTAFVANAKQDPAAMLAAAGPYAPAFQAYRGWVGGQAAQGAQLSRDVAGVVVRTLTEGRPAFRIQTSDWATAYVAAKLADPDGAVIQALTRSWVAAPTTVTASAPR